MERRTFLKLIGATAASATVAGGAAGLAGCGSNDTGGSAGGSADVSADVSVQAEDFDIDITVDGTHYSKWSEIVEAAKGGNVIYMGYKGDVNRDAWTEDVWGARLSEKYGITLEYVDDLEIPTLILNDLENGVGETEGTFDIGWINGLWFTMAQEQHGYFGPINDALPNFANYIDTSDVRVQIDAGYPIDGYETPFGSAMVIFYKNAELMPETPRTCDELLECAKKYPGKMTYVDFGDEGGFGRGPMATFVFNILGPDALNDVEADYDTVKEVVEPVMSWLRDLNPYLWKEGTTFPASEAAIDKMFTSGELVMSMSFSQYSVGVKINDGTFPETTESFMFDKGMCSNFNYMGIPYDAPNKLAALVAINEMLDPEVQLELYRSSNGPVLDMNKLPEDIATEFDSIDLGPNNPTPAEVQAASVPDLPSDIQDIIIEIWRKEVVGKTN